MTLLGHFLCNLGNITKRSVYNVSSIYILGYIKLLEVCRNLRPNAYRAVTRLVRIEKGVSPRFFECKTI